MYELHENEQYFFDQPTLDHLVEFLSRWDSPCCICAPLLGKALVDAGINVTILDIDDRFSSLKGFHRFDINRPEWLGKEFDIIVCDPPFYNVSLSQLFAALRTLARNDFAQPLLVSYLARRSHAVINTFTKFQLQPTGYFPAYQTVKKCDRNDIEFFSNLSDDQLQGL